MKKNKYEKLILSAIDKDFDRVYPLMAIAYLILAAIELKESSFFTFAYIASGITVLIIFFFKNYLSATTKARSVLAQVIILGVLLVFKTGFYGTGLTILIFVHIVAAAFFSFKSGIIISSVTAFIATVPCFLVSLDVYEFSGEFADLLNIHYIWEQHLAAYYSIVIAIHVIFRILKNYLIKNIIDLENSVSKVSTLAYYDQLTKLPNRNKFTAELLNNSNNNYNSGFLILFDLRDFTRINSIYGSDYGDDILEKIGISIREIKNEKEMVARISGNEFAYWLEDVTCDELTKRLKSVYNQLHSKLRNSGISKKIRFHIGYARYPNDAETIKEVYQKASMALEFAKKRRDNIIVPYDKTINVITQEEEIMKEMLLEAIEQGSFQVAYQEKVDTRTGKVYGVEALARWHADDKRWISPSVFMPVIEKNNLSLPFTKIIIDKVMSEYPLLQNRYSEDIKVSINTSPSNISDTSFSKYLTCEISKHQYCPRNFIIEVTEDVMINGTNEETMHTLCNLREFGIAVSLDDFGTGYSSLSYFSELEVDEVKIDKSFIDKIGKDPKTDALIKAIIIVGSSFDISIVAEGVETKEQSKLLNDMGCYNIQGYLFSKPKLLSE